MQLFVIKFTNNRKSWQLLFYFLYWIACMIYLPGILLATFIPSTNKAGDSILLGFCRV